MATKVFLPGSETIDFNLKVENQAKCFYRFETWTAIMAALLLGGIVPNDYWRNPPGQSGNSTRPSLLDQFKELRKNMAEKNRRPLLGLDGEILTVYSPRFHQAERVLRKWVDIWGLLKISL